MPDTADETTRTTESIDRIQSLVEQAQSGSEDAMTLLLETYRGSVASTIRNRLQNASHRATDWEDCLQDVECTIVSKLSKLEYRGPIAFEAWLRRIAFNRAIDLLRTPQSNSIPTDAEGKQIDFVATESHSVGSRVADEEIRILVHQEFARNRIPASHKRALVAYYSEGLKGEELAERLNVSRTAAAMRVSRAIAWVRENLSILTRLDKAVGRK